MERLVRREETDTLTLSSAKEREHRGAGNSTLTVPERERRQRRGAEEEDKGKTRRVVFAFFVEIAETLDDVHRIRVMDMIEKAELQQIVDEEEENKED